MSEKQYSQAPEMEIDPTKKYQAIIELEKGGLLLLIFWLLKHQKQ